MRVHELAKELGLSSKDILSRLHELGVEAKSHMSSVEQDAIDLLKEASRTTPASPAKAEPPTAAPPPPVEAAAAGEKETSTAPTREEETVPPPEARPEKAPPPEGKTAPAGLPPGQKVVRIKGPVIVRDLARFLDIRPNQLIAELMKMNVLASITQRVEVNVARAIGEKHGVRVEHEKKTAENRPSFAKRAAEEPETAPDRPEDLLPRAPVVTFLGHVDHGKTSLLDKIRNTAVVDGEYGGITQHIGAYTVDAGGRQITFLDTPGHAAFTAMRARGANITDIAVIIIAADDGIMPQTREALMHAKAAEVSVMIAINKVDLPGADSTRVKQQLQAEGLAPEDWGGSVICCEVSAATGEGIDHLLEMILLQADVLELKANPKRRAQGYVIEARIEQGMGPTANILVKSGTLNLGDFVLCGAHCGKVRALINDHGLKVKSAGPSTPVKCLGLSGVPEAGAEFRVYKNEKAARAMATDLSHAIKKEELAAPRKASLESLFDQIKDNEKVDFRIVLKADTQGSVEAIAHSLDEIPSDKVSLNILLKGTGNVTVNDVMLASASNAAILGFHVGKEPGVDAACRHEGVSVTLHNIIYELIDAVRKAMTGLLEPIRMEDVLGHAEIRQVFPVGKTGRIAGCYVTDGTISSRHKVRLRRGDEELFSGSLMSLKRFQDNVSEVREGQECGIRLERFSAIATGDILEFYEVREIQQTL